MPPRDRKSKNVKNPYCLRVRGRNEKREEEGVEAVWPQYVVEPQDTEGQEVWMG